MIFVGTGPGDPDLLTLGAIAALAERHAVILTTSGSGRSSSIPRSRWPEGAEVSTIGLTEADAADPVGSRQDRAQAHLDRGRVVRWSPGDPFLDNAVADEAAACPRGGIDFEVVPGVSA